MLEPSVKHMPGEALESFVSRLASINGLATANELCVDLGVSFPMILSGNVDAVTYLADLSGNAVAPLLHEALRPEGKRFVLRGQTLTKTGLVRSRIRICPECLNEDRQRASSAIPEQVAGYGRTTWKAESLRTCVQHDVVMVDLPAGSLASAREFVSVVAPHLSQDRAGMPPVRRRAASAFERYLHGRLEGQDGDCWLDTLPFFAAARSCEILGAVAVFGRTPNLNTLTTDDWMRAGQEGFHIASNGLIAIEGFMEHLWASYSGDRATPSGPQAWFGRLHQWLGSKLSEPEYQPIRDAIIRFVADRTPFNPNELVCGCPVPYRRVHSLRTAAVETKLSGKRLRRALDHAGHLPAGHEALTDHEVTFDASATRELLRLLASSMSVAEIAKAWDISWMQTRELIHAGHLRPIAPLVSGTTSVLFDGEEVDAFIKGLQDGAVEVEGIPEGYCNLGAVCHQAQCRLADVTGLIAARKLSWVGRRRGVLGLRSIIVNVDEVRGLLRGPDLRGRMRRHAQHALRISNRTMNALIERGIIAATVQRHPSVAKDVVVIAPEELDRFAARYMRPTEVAARLGVTIRSLPEVLQEHGIEPVLATADFHAPFYARASLDAIK